MGKPIDENDALRRSAQDASQLIRARKSAQSGGQPPAPGPSSPAGPQTLGRFISRNLIYILSVVAVVALVTLGLIIAAPFMRQDSLQNVEESYISPYDWTKLDRQGDRFAYRVDGQETSRLGIDVSENQHAIDWDAVAADGVEFAMIRLGYRGATEGDLYLDEYYWANLDGARDAGIDCGIYFFSQAKTPEEAREEADFVLTYLNGTPLEYPIAFDSEEKVLGLSQSRTSGLDNDTMSAIAEAFCQRIEEAGYESIIYGNANDMSRYNRASLEGDEIWWAEYGVPSPTNKLDIHMWQYSNTGRVAGIEGDVDMNIDLRHALDEPSVMQS